MKRVLIVTYYFPPSGGPGVQRVLKFAKYLPEFGWEPIVLTVKDADYPARDESLLKEIPPAVRVYRTKIFEPYNFYRKLTKKKPGTPVDVDVIPREGAKRAPAEWIAEFVRSTFFIPDARIGWYRHAVRAGKQIVREERIEAIYSSSPPYTSALIARRLHKLTGKPWIAGFRDPWIGFLSAPRRWFLPRAIDKHLERSCFEDCDRLEVAWKGILKDFHDKYPAVPLDKCYHLPNGYDSADYPKIEKRKNEKFTITYTGSMYGKRNPESLLKAVEELVHEGAVDVDRICLRFVGRFGAEVQRMFQSDILKNCIDVRPYLPHSESIKLLLQSDALLMIVDEFTGNEEIVPGKVFEYLGAHRPILTIAPEGAVTDLMRETASGQVAYHHDIPKVKNIFLEFYTNFLYHKTDFKQHLDRVKQYERREIAKQLARLLDEVTM